MDLRLEQQQAVLTVNLSPRRTGTTEEVFGDYVTSEYTRVRGHGMGLFPDQKPHILEDVNIVLETGMALIVHPNTYHPAVGYLVLGDSLLVREGGRELLCGTPRELFNTTLE